MNDKTVKIMCVCVELSAIMGALVACDGVPSFLGYYFLFSLLGVIPVLFILFAGEKMKNIQKNKARKTYKTTNQLLLKARM